MPKMKINKKLEKIFTAKQPIIVIIGGRGSGKSIGVGDILTFKMDTEQADIYCLREFQDSVTDSVHRVFADSINKRLKLNGWTVQEKTVIAPNGAKTVYKGANRNPDSMQSAQGYKYSWFEEAHRASESSLDKLLPTILRNPGAKCIFTANPQSSGDAFSQRFIVPYLDELEKNGIYEDEVHLIIVVNWRDNPWWNKEQELLRQWDYNNLSRAKYDWIWEGKFNDSVDNAIIQPEWFDACIDAHVKLGIKPQGIEVVAHDPSDEGEDSKGLAHRHGIVLKDVTEMTTGNINDGGDWAADYTASVKADVFTWDCDGMGVGLNRQFNEALTPKKISLDMYRGSESPRNPDAIFETIGEGEHKKIKTNGETFFNKRAQAYWLLRERMRKTYLATIKGEYHNPDDLFSISSDIKAIQAVRSELCRIPTVPNGSGKIQIMSKKDMASKLKMKSPNMADAIVMAMFYERKAVNNVQIHTPRPMANRW